MTKEKFIYDNGKVRNCFSNIAQMNVFEWIYYNKNYLISSFIEQFINVFKGIKLIFFALIGLFLFLIFPISLTCAALYAISEAKTKTKKR